MRAGAVEVPNRQIVRGYSALCGGILAATAGSALAQTATPPERNNTVAPSDRKNHGTIAPLDRNQTIMPLNRNNTVAVAENHGS
ncbi:hypothetical protein [Streptomyces sp. 8N706]|uniref:hypothetical protein n=1 Tax=Streptomyces sp. 8N706 TaxID=3457416 RepID=UPI003FCEEAA7